MTNRPLWSIIGHITFVGIGYILYTGYLIPELTAMGSLTLEAPRLPHSWFMWPVIGYILISGSVCMLVSIFKPLKPLNNERSLLFALGACFIWGLVVGLIAGSFWGNLTSVFYWGLQLGLATGLLVGLVTGLIVGLSMELKRK